MDSAPNQARCVGPSMVRKLTPLSNRVPLARHRRFIHGRPFKLHRVPFRIDDVNRWSLAVRAIAHRNLAVRDTVRREMHGDRRRIEASIRKQK